MARQSAELAPKLETLLASVLVQVGDRVRRDAAVATLDARSLRGDLAVAQAAVQAARAELDRTLLDQTEAEERYERRQGLSQSGTGSRLPALSPEELASARYSKRRTELRVAAARADLQQKVARSQQLAELLADTTIRAPFAGTVAARYLDAGNLVGPRTPILQIVSDDDLWVRFAVPPQQAKGIAPGRSVRVRIDETGELLTGTVAHVPPEVDSASQLWFVEARLVVPSVTSGKPLAGRIIHVSLADEASVPRGPLAAGRGG
jgi:RND family efflux transporter MFP subunit